jgi:hypothetical protein
VLRNVFMSAKLVVGDAEGGGLDCEPPIGAILAPSGLGQHHLVLQATTPLHDSSFSCLVRNRQQ